ncbi:type I toxin-antitoxin system Fst family toxin [Enterococcus sp. AZ128]
MLYEFLCPLLVGIIVTLFDYWLNSRDKK